MGALVFLDINPNAPRPDGQPGRWSDTSIAIGLNASGVPATEFVMGLGFALSFGRADRLYLKCPGLLPSDGLTLDIRDHGVDAKSVQILEHAVLVTTTLAQLTALDGRERYLSPSGTRRDIAVAELVLALLREGEVRQRLERPYRYALAPDAAGKDPDELTRGVERALGELAGEPTVVAELRIEGAANARLLEVDGTTVLEALARGQDAEVVMALVGPVPEPPTGASAGELDDRQTRLGVRRVGMCVLD